MSPLTLSRLKIALVGAGIFAVGLGAGAYGYRQQSQRLVTELERHAQVAAVAFDRSQLRALSGTPADLGSPVYVATKERLARLKATDAPLRNAYLIRWEAKGDRVVVLADAAATASEAARPGDVVPDAERSAGLQSTIRDGQPAVDGPVHDEHGTWVTGYAVVRPSSAPTADPPPQREIVAIDLSAEGWARAAWGTAFRDAVATWILLGLPVFALLTTRRHGEQREAIRNLSEAVEQSHSAIIILDLQHRIEYANRGMCQQIGYGRRELIGRQWRDFVGGPDAAATISDLVSTIRMGRAWEGEWHNQRKDGSVFPVHGMVTPVRQRDGTIACFVAIFDDVSDIKRKEDELREARDLARAGDRAKGQFLATMSHEVRTPLNGIVGFTSLLLETPLTPEQREFVQTIRASGEALIQLTGDILDFARIESGKLKLDPIACDPRECIEEALDLHAAKAAEKHIELLHHADENVPSAVVVDGGRLRQVLVNLVGNAVKFTERGEVEVTVRTTMEPAAASEHRPATGEGVCVLEFAVRDTGIGIAPPQQERLFKPFSQVDESSTRRYGGVGLGLAICKNLVQLMGGGIALESAPGAGTTVRFTVRVPIAATQAAPRQLDGLRVALAVAPGSLRRELIALLGTWGADVSTADTIEAIAGKDWEIALVEVNAGRATELAARTEPLPGLPPEKSLAIVPISLGSELRTALRSHFKLLVNRPIHHGPLFGMLSGARPVAAGAARTTPQFGLRVLVVEDNEVNQRLLQRVLRSLGCTATLAGNGVEAISTLTVHADQFDLVLLDLHMPEMDGLQALERIRRGEAGPIAQGIWVIALTADVRPEQRARGLELGLNDYLTKPLRTCELEASFRRFRAERGQDGDA